MPDASGPTHRNAASDPVQAPARSGGPGGGRPPNNLPLELTGLVGRGREISEVERLLSGNRLLTLTGSGGSGKTRLALAAAADLSKSFRDGAWWVALAPLFDPDLVPQAVASVLGVGEAPGTTPVDSVRARLEGQETLLILDNCEHLVDACASLSDTLLRSCPGLRVLATSREALGVVGEALFVVPPLSLPDPRHLRGAEGLSHYEATRLFAERARAIRPGFEVTDQNAAAVAQICYRLDGLPLAIELAAARARALSVEQIASRLDDRFALLTGGGRTASAHQGTLRATMEWSHDLLGPKERTLFRRLSVFAGGFTLGAAEAVCPGGDVEEGEVLDLLSSLVDKSLVQVADRDGGARYGLLETVKEYATEKLGETGEETEFEGRHASFFLRLAEEAERESRGARQVAWLGRLEAEHDNLRAVLERALENGEADLGLRVAGSLGGFWLVRGRLSEGRRWLEAALRNGAGAQDSARILALLRTGLIAREQGDHERAAKLLGQTLALARRVGDKDTAAIALLNLGWAALLRDELSRASELTEESLVLQRETNDELGVARALTVLGLVANAQGDHERAMALHEEGLGLARKAQDAGAIALSLMQGALASLGRGDLQGAGQLCEEGLELSWRLKMVHPTASHLQIAASVSSSQGQPARSARLWGAAEAWLAAVGLKLASLERRFYEPYVAAGRSRLGEVAFEEAWAEGRMMTAEEAVGYALESPDTPEEAEVPPAYPAGLSAREVEILRLVVKGMTNARIAEELFISPRTVNGHLTSAYKKTGASGRAEAARFATEHGLL